MPERSRAPGGDIDRAERLLAVGVVVVPVVVAVVVGRVMRDGAVVAGCVVGVRSWSSVVVDLRPAFWQTARGDVDGP